MEPQRPEELVMKVGDIIRVCGSHAQIVGTIIDVWRIEDWWIIMTEHGQLIHWPESQMELVE